MTEAPIQDLESIDIVGEKNDGTIDLCIVASTYLDGSESHNHLLKQKIQVYVNEILSDEWLSKYGEGKPSIIIKATEMPHQETINVIGAVKNYLKGYNIGLSLEII
jgi:hypothetical protein